MSVTLLPARQVLARRRPGAIVFLYTYELVWSLLVAAPIHSLARTVWSAHPDGDAALFRAGSLDLVGWAMRNDAALGSAMRTTMLFVLCGAVLALLPRGVMFASLAMERSGRSLRLGEALAYAWTGLWPMYVASVVTIVIQGVTLGVGGGAAYLIEEAMTAGSGDAHAIRNGVVVFVVFGLLALVVGVLGDVWQAAIMRGIGPLEEPAKTSSLVWSSLKLALRGPGFGAAVFGWTWRVLAAVGLVLLGAGLSGSAWPLLVVFIGHQLLIAGRVCLRAGWLAEALRIVARRAPT